MIFKYYKFQWVLISIGSNISSIQKILTSLKENEINFGYWFINKNVFATVGKCYIQYIHSFSETAQFMLKMEKSKVTETGVRRD